MNATVRGTVPDTAGAVEGVLNAPGRPTMLWSRLEKVSVASALLAGTDTMSSLAYPCCVMSRAPWDGLGCRYSAR
ncbi:MAG: hypothetical protein R6X31_10250 [Anaerolineae bacterium]